MKLVALLIALVAGSIVFGINLVRSMSVGAALFSAIITSSVVYVMATPDKQE